jgi:hypothetical protein
MNRKIIYVICVLAATMLVHAIEAQSITSTGKAKSKRGTLTTDTTICQRMQRDLNTRNSMMGSKQLD